MSIVVVNGSNHDSYQRDLALNRTPTSLADIPQAYQEEITEAVRVGDSERAEQLVAQYVSDMIGEYESYLESGETRAAQQTYNILVSSLNTLFSQIHPDYVGGTVQRQGQSISVVLCFRASQQNRPAANEPSSSERPIINDRDLAELTGSAMEEIRLLLDSELDLDSVMRTELSPEEVESVNLILDESMEQIPEECRGEDATLPEHCFDNPANEVVLDLTI